MVSVGSSGAAGVAGTAGRAPRSLPFSTEAALAFVAGLALVIGMHFHHVPFNNEFLYLLYPYRWFHPDYLAGDWTLATPEREHLVYNFLVGGAMRFAPPVAVQWTGRLVCWILLIVGWLRLARHLGIRPLLAILALAIWLGAGQSLYGGEWLFQTFESKVVAYTLVLFGIDQILLGNDRRGGALLGLAFTLHPAVGLSTGIAAAVGVMLLRRERRRVVRFAVAALAGALPGIVVALPLLVRSAGPPGDGWQVLVHVVLPMHLDPGSWNRGPILLSALMLLFNFVQYRMGPKDPAWRFLIGLECALAAITAFGFAAYGLGLFPLLAIYPFRVFPLLITPCFLLHLFRAFGDGQLTPRHPLFASLALVTVLRLPSPSLFAIPWVVADRVAEWHAPAGDAQRALLWIREHTASDAIVAAPPWLKESFYLTERAQVANLWAVVNDRLDEWRARNEALIGPLGSFVPGDRNAMREHFEALAIDDLAVLRRRYGAGVLVTRGAYSLPLLHREGEYAVYDLRPLGN
jgi:hypothetical protein